MQALLLAAVHPDNTPHGYNLTFAFPELMFIIVAGALYLRFRRPHRVPGHVAQASAPQRTAAPAQPAAGAAEDTPAPAGEATQTVTTTDESTEATE